MWDKRVNNGVIRRVVDDELQSLVYKIEGTNVNTNFITCPVDKTKSLGIEYPCMTIIMKAVSDSQKVAKSKVFV